MGYRELIFALLEIDNQDPVEYKEERRTVENKRDKTEIRKGCKYLEEFVR